MDSILFSLENGVAKITLNRPDKYNSINREMALAIQHYIKECKDNAEVRALYITGAGKAFSAGQDLQEVLDPESPDITTIIGEHYNPLIEAIRGIEKPVIAAVNGVAAGAAANIALACDIIVAAESAYFLQAFSKIGLIPDSGGTFFLPRIIGFQRATALMMLGEKVYAKEAERIGMIYKSAPDDELEDTAMKLAQKLAKMPTRGLGLTKRALNYSVHNDLTTQLGIEEQLQTTASNTKDHAEGVQAFVEKRKPEFTGN